MGLPGTGLSYTHTHSSNLNNVGTRKTSLCPNCGHRMRKQWTNCPKCNFFLLNIIPNQQDNIQPQNSHLNNVARTGTSGCLLQVLMMILIVLWSYF